MPKSVAVVLCAIPLVLLAACGAGGPVATEGPVAKRTIFYGWSGYSTVGHYTQVSAAWVQPAVVCPAKGVSHSSFWVGLDGVWPSDPQTVEQTGIEADCSRGTPFYRAWYELVPTEKVYVPYSSVVKPGDKISASVTTDGDGHFTLSLSDPSEDWTKKTPAALGKARLGSAEVIVEKPVNAQGHTLANFGIVRFTHATANGRSFSDLNGLQRINMARPDGRRGPKVEATTSPMSNGAFLVTWKHP